MTRYFHPALANTPHKDHQQPQPISYLPDQSYSSSFPPQGHWETCSHSLLHSSLVSWIPCSSGDTVSPDLLPVTVDNGALMKWPSRSNFFPYSGSPGNSSSLQHPLRCLFTKINSRKADKSKPVPSPLSPLVCFVPLCMVFLESTSMAKYFGDRTCFLPSAYLSVFVQNYLKIISSKLSCSSELRNSSILAMAILMTILIFFHALWFDVSFYGPELFLK